jgi:1-acyl-sn-glycerol-3-phosphate acyltransferase
MKRMLMIIIRKLFYIPHTWIKLCYYASHVNKYSEKEHYSLMRDIANLIIGGGKIDIRVFGQKNIPAKNGFMLFPNHQGLFDAFAIVRACPAPFSVVYKTELKDIPFMKQILACVRAVALERDNIRQGLKVIQQVSAELETGRNFMIFAEGTRSKSENDLLDFKGGSFKSAIKSKCPIIPIALIDSYKVFDTGNTDTVIVQVHILEAIEYEEYHDMKAVEIASLVRDRIKNTIEMYS